LDRNEFISTHFRLHELTKSDIAIRFDISNDPPPEVIENLKLVAVNVLEPIRAKFGPFAPQSGYRCIRVNDILHSRPSSDHVTGCAADIEIHGTSNLDLAQWCVDNLHEWRQIILEFYNTDDPRSGWVHVAYKAGDNKKQVLTIGKGFTRNGLG
jgi:hypothetical protein